MKQEDLITRILKSIFFKSATSKAGKYAGKGVAILELLREVLGKAKDVADNQNKGVGQVLVEKTYAHLRQHSFQSVPVCSYIQALVKRNSELVTGASK